MDTIEVLARMWMECDPNRGDSNPDEIMEPMCSGGTGLETRTVVTDLTGQPHWKWFIPRAEASLAYLRKHGDYILDTPRPDPDGQRHTKALAGIAGKRLTYRDSSV